MGTESPSSILSSVSERASLLRAVSNLFQACKTFGEEEPFSPVQYSSTLPSIKTMISYRLMVAGGRDNI